MLNIVVPMAGAGRRFTQAGFTRPKPLVPVLGEPMVRVVIDNLRPQLEHRFVFVTQAKHVEEYGLADKLTEWAPGCVVVQIDGVTDGAARTVLRASIYIENDDSLMIANSDQYVSASTDAFLADMADRNLDASIMTMTSSDPKWSFVGFDAAGAVEQVVEKVVISNEATVGIYAFARGRDFVECARRMIEKDLKSSGEFYVAPVYNELLARNGSVGTYNIGADGDGMHGLGTPSDLSAFTSTDVAKRAVGGLK